MIGGTSALASDDAPSGETARLVVKGENSEGALQSVVVERRDTGATVLRREFRGRVWLNRGLPHGRYRFVSFARSGGLGEPTDRCGRDFRLRRGRTLRAALRIRAGTRCRVQFSAPRVRIRGETRADEGLARDLLRYLRRNAGSASWYPALRTLEARRGVFTVRSTLRQGARGRAAADQVCSLIQGADLADFTPGHTVRGRKGRQIMRCPARRE